MRAERLYITTHRRRYKLTVVVLLLEEAQKASFPYRAVVNVWPDLVVRSAPGGADTGKRLKNRQEVQVLELQGGWARLGPGEWVSTRSLIEQRAPQDAAPAGDQETGRRA